MEGRSGPCWIFSTAAFAMLVLLHASASRGAVGDPIPFSGGEAARLRASASGGDFDEIVGALPLTLAFDVETFGPPLYCRSTGSATASLENGVIVFHSQGSIIGGPNCPGVAIDLEDLRVDLFVPDVGDRSTPVLLSQDRVSSTLVDIGNYGIGDVTLDALQSAVTGGDFAGEYTGYPLSAAIHMLIPNDLVSYRVHLGASYAKGLATQASFDERYEIHASLPPTAQMGAVPLGMRWLLAGLILGLGVRVAHHRHTRSGASAA